MNKGNLDKRTANNLIKITNLWVYIQYKKINRNL